MYDYLTELHQPSTISENNNLIEEEQIKIPDGSTSLFNSSYDNRREEPQQQQQEHNGRSALNCSCSRTLSGDNIYQTKTRNRNQPRICSLS